MKSYARCKLIGKFLLPCFFLFVATFSFVNTATFKSIQQISASCMSMCQKDLEEISLRLQSSPWSTARCLWENRPPVSWYNPAASAPLSASERYRRGETTAWHCGKPSDPSVAYWHHLILHIKPNLLPVPGFPVSAHKLYYSVANEACQGFILLGVKSGDLGSGACITRQDY